MIIKIEDIKKWEEQRRLWNSTPLEEIEFTYEGVKIAPEVVDDNGIQFTLEEFKFTGMANIDYLLFVLKSVEQEINEEW